MFVDGEQNEEKYTTISFGYGTDVRVTSTLRLFFFWARPPSPLLARFHYGVSKFQARSTGQDFQR